MRVVAPPQRPTAAILYSNPHGCPCTLSGDLHGLSVLHGKLQNEEAWVLISLCVVDSEGIVFGLFLVIILHPNLVRSRSLEPLGVGRSYFYTR